MAQEVADLDPSEEATLVLVKPISCDVLKRKVIDLVRR
jgi:hypothetical protein